MGDISSKERILVLLEILKNETDEENQLSIQHIINKLKLRFGPNFNIKRKAITSDLEVLGFCDIPITANTGHKGRKFYSYQNRDFEVYELNILIDAVNSARFVAKEEKEKLIKKIRGLTSKGLAKKLKGAIHVQDWLKAESPFLRQNIDELQTAIHKRRKVRFQYGNYNVNKEFHLHRSGEFYLVHPYSLLWYNDFYYLIGKFEKLNEIRHYRVDRMRNVELADKGFNKPFIDIVEHINKAFNMYPGDANTIKIKFNNKLINAVLDKVGLKADIKKADENSFILTFKAAINEGLIRWILTWGSDAEVLFPDKLVEKMKSEVNQMQSLYNEGG